MRDRAWWARLSADERRTLYMYEHAGAGTRSAMLPDDCVECPVCSTPHAGFGNLCPWCSSARVKLIAIGNGEVRGEKSGELRPVGRD